VIEANDGGQFSSQLDNLTRISHRIAEALYQQGGGTTSDAASAGAQGQSTGGSAGKSSGSDDVIDAEYIDVDENK
ncbi:MAG: molecular chaperone DnaK, partial [Blastocatellia bacterium]|nr:molecular chaperone DnaK [Blastocatellia bacterium]